jgi:hypothetical protein
MGNGGASGGAANTGGTSAGGTTNAGGENSGATNAGGAADGGGGTGGSSSDCDSGVDGGCGTRSWIRQFGTTNDDGIRGVALDSQGNVYVVGIVSGALPGQTSAGSYDAFVRKYDARGVEQWTRQFGSADSDSADSVSVDESGNVYVAGEAAAALPGQPHAGAWDAFVRKYDTHGTEQWTREFGSAGYDAAAVSVAIDGTAIVSGFTELGLPGEPIGDAGADAGAGAYLFLRAYDASGAARWTRQFGGRFTGPSFGQLWGSARAIDGSIYIAGRIDGTLPGQVRAGDEDAFVRKLDGSGNEVWTRQFGSAAEDIATSVASDVNGNVYVAGRTFGALPGQANAGVADAYVRKYDASGTEVWTRQFGTSVTDVATSVIVDDSGVVYVGGATNGTLPDQTRSGSTDAFIRRYDGSGNELGTVQFGTTDIEQGLSLGVASDGSLYVGGQTTGAFPGFVNPSPSFLDAFLAKFAP